MRLLVQAGTITALAVAIVACGGSSQAAEPANPTSQSQGESASSSVASEDIIVIQYANITRTFPTFDYMAEYSRRISRAHQWPCRNPDDIVCGTGFGRAGHVAAHR